MLSILKSALMQTQKKMGIVSNNIANVNSTAFKKSKTNFEHIYSRDRSSSPSKFSGQGVGVNDPLLQMSQGSLKTTNGALDLSYNRLRFLYRCHEETLETPFFTRDGSFNITATGEVVTNDGLKVMGYLGEDNQILKNIVIPPNKINEDETTSMLSNINVDSSGKITATYGFDDEVVIGNFILASFPNETGLRQVGNNRYEINSKSGLPNFGFPMDAAFGKIELVI